MRARRCGAKDAAARRESELDEELRNAGRPRPKTASGRVAASGCARDTRSYNPGMRTTAELREGFLSFFESKGHLRCPSGSLIPRAGDRSTLLDDARACSR